VEEYFALGYVAEPRTIFVRRSSCRPAHSLLHPARPAGAPAPRRYWDVRFRSDNAIEPGETLRAELIRRLRESVRLRMISEVPLGAFLSGRRRFQRRGGMMAGLSTQPVNTCSIAFDDPQVRRIAFAQQVATATAPTTASKWSKSDDFDLIDTLAGCTTSPTPTVPPCPPTASASWRAST
jgi:asparagine synthase (glutamine-hydrolysing)